MVMGAVQCVGPAKGCSGRAVRPFSVGHATILLAVEPKEDIEDKTYISGLPLTIL
jgi:hypothetical protein